MFRFLKKDKESNNADKTDSLISEEKLSELLESVIGDTERDFQFLESVDILEKKVVTKDLLHARMRLKHKNGDSVDVSVTKSRIYFRSELEERIDRVITQTWKFEFEDLVRNLRKSAKAIEGFNTYIINKKVVSVTYLGITYDLPISEIVRFDDKLRESNLDPIYEDVRIFTGDLMNRHCHRRESMNIYGIVKWWIEIHK